MLLATCALAFAVRLVDVGEPFLDQQLWRQADTAAVARNFYEEGYDLLHPRVDWRGDTPGYVEMEFPLYQFLVATLYLLVGGPREWVGHLVSALLSTATIPLLYALARDLCGVSTARFASLVFALAPVDVFFGRAFMVDPAMLFFGVGALLFFARWSRGGSRWEFSAAALFAALAFLVKVPSLYLGLPLLFLAWRRYGAALVRQPAPWLFAACTLLPAALWYRHAYGLFEQTHLTFGIWNRYGQSKWGSVALLSDGAFYGLMLERLAGVVLTPIGFALMFGGMLMPLRSRDERLLWVWLAAVVLYVLVVAEGNRMHPYYQLPFVPVGAVFAGKALAGLWNGGRRGGARRRAARRIVVAVLLLGFAALSYAYAAPLFARQPYYVAQYEVGREVDALIPRDALLVVADLDDNAGTPYRCQAPNLLYFAHRKGWQLMPAEFRDRALLQSLIARGADYFLVPRQLAYMPDEGHLVLELQDARGNLLRRFEKHLRR